MSVHWGTCGAGSELLGSTDLDVRAQGALSSGAVSGGLGANVDVSALIVGAEDSASDHIATLEVVVVLVEELRELVVEALHIKLGVDDLDGLLCQGGSEDGQAAGGDVGADGGLGGGDAGGGGRGRLLPAHHGLGRAGLGPLGD